MVRRLISVVRLATQEDVHRLLPLSKAFAETIEMGDYHNNKHSALLLSSMVSQGVLVCFDNHKGILGGLPTPSPWNPSVSIFQEMIFYVNEDSRGSRDTMKMFRMYHDNLPTTTIDTMKAMYNSPELDKLYSKYGYEPMETTYYRRK